MSESAMLVAELSAVVLVCGRFASYKTHASNRIVQITWLFRVLICSVRPSASKKFEVVATVGNVFSELKSQLRYFLIHT